MFYIDGKFQLGKFLDSLNKDDKSLLPILHKEWVQAYNSLYTHFYADREGLGNLIMTRRDFYGTSENGLKAFQNRQKSIKPITRSILIEAQDLLFDIFNRSRINLNLNAEQQTALKQLEQEGTFENGNDIYYYFISEIIPFMLSDANGYIVVIPKGEGVYTDKKDIELKILHVFSDCIIYEKNNILVFLSDELTDNNEPVYYILSKGLIFKMFKDKKSHKFTIFNESTDISRDVYYAPKFEKVTAIKNQGDATYIRKHCTDDKNGPKQKLKYYESFLSMAIPWADELIEHFSDNQQVWINASFPVTLIQSTRCKVCSGKGTISVDDTSKHADNIYGAKKEMSCVTCGGEGSIGRISPDKVFNITTEGRAGDGRMVNDPVKFVSPNPAIIKNHTDHFIWLKNELRRSLRLLFLDEAQSGVAKDIDREGKRSFLNKLANNLGRIIDELLIICFLYKGVDSDVNVLISKDFKLGTAKELEAEYMAKVKEGLPASDIYPTYLDYVSKRFQNDTKALEVAKLIPLYDCLYFANTQKIQLLKGCGTITDFEVFKSKVVFKVLCNELEKNPNYLMKPEGQSLPNDIIFRKLDVIIDGMWNDHVKSLEPYNLNRLVDEVEANA